MIGVCKFCRCTHNSPCLIAAVKLPFAPSELALARDLYILPAGIAVIPPDAQSLVIPCEWLLRDLCSNPACVERAYLEARSLAPLIDEELNNRLQIAGEFPFDPYDKSDNEKARAIFRGLGMEQP